MGANCVVRGASLVNPLQFVCVSVVFSVVSEIIRTNNNVDDRQQEREKEIERWCATAGGSCERGDEPPGFHTGGSDRDALI